MINLHLLSTKLLLYFSFVILIYIVAYSNRVIVNSTLISPEGLEKHQRIVNKYYDARKNWVTSNLGKYLFKNTDGRKPYSYADIRLQGRKFFNVLVWRYWASLRGRHTEAYGQHAHVPLTGCSVTNCKFTEDDHPRDVRSADAVVVHLQHGFLPKFKRRDSKQLWIFWSDVSPNNTFISKGRKLSFKQLANIFNWSMTYRSDSDIPEPYGRTVRLPYPKLNEVTIEDLRQLVPYWKQKTRDVLAVTVMSECLPFRLQFIKRLQRFISVDTFGECALVEKNKERCPGHDRVDCPDIAKYLFYILIENSNCRQYITEKVFHNSYAKGAIPIIAGVPLGDCKKLLPPKSFLHVDNFSSLRDLAKELYRIRNSVMKLLSYHAWRNNFKTLEEHGYFGTRSFAFCRICEALNYNDLRPKQYNISDIRLYLDPEGSCKPSSLLI